MNNSKSTQTIFWTSKKNFKINYKAWALLFRLRMKTFLRCKLIWEDKKMKSWYWSPKFKMLKIQAKIKKVFHKLKLSKLIQEDILALRIKISKKVYFQKQPTWIQH